MLIITSISLVACLLECRRYKRVICITLLNVHDYLLLFHDCAGQIEMYYILNVYT